MPGFWEFRLTKGNHTLHRTDWRLPRSSKGRAIAEVAKLSIADVRRGGDVWSGELIYFPSADEITVVGTLPQDPDFPELVEFEYSYDWPSGYDGKPVPIAVVD